MNSTDTQRYVARAGLINYFYLYLGVKKLYFKKPIEQWEMVVAGAGLAYQLYGMYNLKPKSTSDIATDLYMIGQSTVFTPVAIVEEPKKYFDNVVLGMD